MSTMTLSFRVSVDEDVTYKKVTLLEWDPVFQVPFPAVQEVEGILEDDFSHARIKDDRPEGAFGTRGDKAPFVSRVGRRSSLPSASCLWTSRSCITRGSCSGPEGDVKTWDPGVCDPGY